MGTIRRQSIQATVVMATGVLLGFVLKLFIFTAYLTPEEIGLLTVLLDSANLVAAFIPLGSQSIFIKYLPYFRDTSGKPRGLLLLGVILAFIGFSIFLLLFALFKESIVAFYADQAPLFSQYIYFLLPLVLFRVTFTLGQAYSWALKKNIFPLLLKDIVVRVLTGILVVAFAWQWFDLDGLVLWFVIIYFISGAIMTFYLSRIGSLNFSKPGKMLQNGKGKEILNFGLFAIMTSGGDIIIRNIDSLMVTSLVSIKATGIYATAFFIGQIIELPRRAIGQITAPFIAEASAKNDQKQITKLFHKTSLNQFLIGSLLLICVWTNIDSLFLFIPNGEKYVSGKMVVLFIGIGKLFDMSMGINGNIIQHSPYFRFNFYTMSIMGVVGIITNFLLLPVLGINGAAIASLATILLTNILKGSYLYKKFHLQPFTPVFMLAIGVSIITYLTTQLLPTLSNPLLDILLSSTFTIFAFGILTVSTRVSPDVNFIFTSILFKIGIKKQ